MLLEDGAALYVRIVAAHNPDPSGHRSQSWHQPPSDERSSGSRWQRWRPRQPPPKPARPPHSPGPTSWPSKSRGFEIQGDGTRQGFALGLLPCLASPDPDLRDGVAFEALSTWMRGGLLTGETATAVLDSLLRRIAPEFPDPEGFDRPFSALVLAEVARMDRIEPFLPDERLAALVAGAVAFLPDVDDYRGFDEREGWRHGVAHGADLMLQLALNPRVGEPELRSMLDAIGAQVAPPGERFYVYGEPGRLARAVYYLAARDLLSSETWGQWFRRISDAAPLGSWDDAFQSQAGLAKRHNTTDFLLALHLFVSQDDSMQERVMPALMEAIQRVP